MANVVATTRGYFGGEIREAGERFHVPDALWRDVARRPRWAVLDAATAFGGKGDHDGDGKVGGSVPAPPAGGGPTVDIAPDWRSGSAAERKALAKAITGQNAPNAAEADRIIAEHVEATRPEAFGDAPEPQSVGNGVVEALGGPVPDWVLPGSDAPKLVTD